jgi:hypothetical protein
MDWSKLTDEDWDMIWKHHQSCGEAAYDDWGDELDRQMNKQIKDKTDEE